MGTWEGLQASDARQDDNLQLMLFDPDTGRMIRGLMEAAEANVEFKQLKLRAELFHLGTTSLKIQGDQTEGDTNVLIQGTGDKAGGAAQVDDIFQVQQATGIDTFADCLAVKPGGAVQFGAGIVIDGTGSGGFGEDQISYSRPALLNIPHNPAGLAWNLTDGVGGPVPLSPPRPTYVAVDTTTGASMLLFNVHSMKTWLSPADNAWTVGAGTNTLALHTSYPQEGFQVNCGLQVGYNLGGDPRKWFRLDATTNATRTAPSGDDAKDGMTVKVQGDDDNYGCVYVEGDRSVALTGTNEDYGISLNLESSTSADAVGSEISGLRVRLEGSPALDNGDHSAIKIADAEYLEHNPTYGNRHFAHAEYNAEADHFYLDLPDLSGGVSRTFVLPGNAPVANYILKTDVDGVTSWVNADTITGNTLGGAYNQGGPGNGRTITADTGPVWINSSANGSLRLNQSGNFNAASLQISGATRTIAAALIEMSDDDYTGRPHGLQIFYGANSISNADDVYAVDLLGHIAGNIGDGDLVGLHIDADWNVGIKTSSDVHMVGSADLFWGTDGGGVIGAPGDKRPDNVYVKSSVKVGSWIDIDGSASTVSVSQGGNFNALSIGVGGATRTVAAASITIGAASFTGRPHGLEISYAAASVNNGNDVYAMGLLGSIPGNIGAGDLVGLYADRNWDIGVHVGDNAPIVFGDDKDVSVEYDEAGNDRLVFDQKVGTPDVGFDMNLVFEAIGWDIGSSAHNAADGYRPDNVYVGGAAWVGFDTEYKSVLGNNTVGFYYNNQSRGGLVYNTVASELCLQTGTIAGTIVLDPYSDGEVLVKDAAKLSFNTKATGPYIRCQNVGGLETQLGGGSSSLSNAYEVEYSTLQAQANSTINGGPMTFAGQKGGAATSGVVAGIGSTFQVQAGNGGHSAFTTRAGGAGGAVTVRSGDGGNNTNTTPGFAGDGADITLYAGRSGIGTKAGDGEVIVNTANNSSMRPATNEQVYLGAPSHVWGATYTKTVLTGKVQAKDGTDNAPNLIVRFTNRSGGTVHGGDAVRIIIDSSSPYTLGIERASDGADRFAGIIESSTGMEQYANNSTADIVTFGMCNVHKASGQVWNPGDVVYLSSTGGYLTTTSGGMRVGYSLERAENADTYASVFIQPSPKPLQFFSYTVSGAPSASPAGQVIYVSNGAAGGKVLAFSDGTNWLRCDTRVAISSS